MLSSTLLLTLTALSSTALAGVVPQGYGQVYDQGYDQGYNSLPFDLGLSYSTPSSTSASSKFNLNSLTSDQLAELLAAARAKIDEHNSIKFNTKDFNELKQKDRLQVHKDNDESKLKEKESNDLDKEKIDKEDGGNSIWKRGGGEYDDGSLYDDSYGGLEGLNGVEDLGAYDGGFDSGLGGYGGFFDNQGRFHKLKLKTNNDRLKEASQKSNNFDLDHDQALDSKKYNEVNYEKENDKSVDLAAQIAKKLRDQQQVKNVDAKQKQEEEGGAGGIEGYNW